MQFDFHSTRSILVERGGAANLAKIIQARGGKSVLIVTDPGVLSAGLLSQSQQGFKDLGIALDVFSQVQADPPISVIENAVNAAQQCRADYIVGFGGGSSMDVAKLVALLATGKEKLSEVYGVGVAKGPRLPLILVPTTAGTGSEVTTISIVTVSDSEKKGVVSPQLLPDLALLDAQLTLGLPSHVTAATGIDAMVHAIEAFTTKRLKNPISDCLAKEALRLLASNLHRAVRSGNDIEARENMLLGACLAGMAFTNAPVAGVHALAYPIGARFHVPHGLSNALMLGPVMRFNLEQAHFMYAELGQIIQPGLLGSTLDQATQLADYLGSLATELGLPGRLTDVGITENDINQLAADAMLQTRLLMNSPREITLQDAAALYAEAL
ncbi:alcohol dehydrogenase class IV [Polynucleobacter sphagniphilus]|jgi:alcohol dehydrogenase class IV|uniref:Alcohol dehydrogenase class IV n=2 Tax=Polynucleobacter sphagniphilus TaxID=1743169 RepID=A0AA43M9T9_9BURK|nr:iron-containing alcohol dehydrogenase [Polynucleobacter sphagniphilus]MDH6241316.1 alcohol dehydrogenase class IV [Polynucleobacter sphagniphilus]MDH6248618.1 alcohol dehydrogenase class IV [Polynucleobacter sphagniphilus]MDH6422004.1 alcohol dehydrogenase class IV [Polynucleobacter sphagniphilus]MDH6503822.1 alcohol dehydrogenase class IV [Polynucleobacter sphagniphilus]MDH6512314.1 alcohol dehydrogenase class IV [Polynucleobacter sphagniphilus]